CERPRVAASRGCRGVSANGAAVRTLPRGGDVRRAARPAAAADRAGAQAMTEAEIIRRIQELFPQRAAKIGIGDDAAVVGEQVITTDMLIEDIDFRRSDPVDAIARKSLVVNLSDIAAMGAIPAYAVVGLGIAPWLLASIDAFLVAIANCARKYDIDLVGGDLSRAEKAVIAVTATGWIGKRPLLRSGAKPGDRVYVSRPIGASWAGLQILNGGWPRDLPYAQREFAEAAVR